MAAAARVLDRDGVAGVAHRAVAAEAGVPLGSTTYYFAGRDELVGAALDAWLTAEEERVAALVAALPHRRRAAPARAALALDVLVGRDRAADRAALTRYYERFVEAGRLAAHRERLARARRAYDAHLAEALGRAGAPAPDVRLVTAAVDGALLNALVDGAADPGAEALPVVARVA